MLRTSSGITLKQLSIAIICICISINISFAQIQTSNPFKTKYCAGDSVSIKFTSLLSTFNVGNEFTVEMSDASGSFATPTTIGSKATETISAISATIPKTTTSGMGYRFRVTSTDPIETSTENPTDIQIIAKAIAYAGKDDTICAGQSYSIPDASFQNADSTKWSAIGTGIFDNKLSLTTLFHPSKADSTAGFSRIILSAYSTCGIAKDTMKLYLFRTPTLNLGHDTLACINDTLNLDYYQATYYNSFDWTSNGTGLFISPNMKNPQYVPSPSDGTKDSITLFCTLKSVCAIKHDTIIIRVKDIPHLTVSPNIIICSGTVSVLSANGADKYEWSNGLNSPNIAVAPSSTRLYKIEASTFCGSSIDSILVTVWATPELETSNDTTIDFMFPASLWVTGGYTYDWAPSTGLSTTTGPTTSANPTADTWYYVTAWDSLHVCTARDSVKVNVYYREYDIWLPSAFTPNKGVGDGNNDLFRPLPLGLHGLKNFTMNIYNRYGNSVFQTTDCNKGWNGIDIKTNIPYDVGTYLYQVSALDPYGKTITKTGSVVLLK